MPLNKKGKKILASMEKRYGKKKGKSVFYAMENSGKLKAVKKAAKGADMQVSGMEAALSSEPGISNYSDSKISSGAGGNATDPGIATDSITSFSSNLKTRQQSAGFANVLPGMGAINVLGAALDTFKGRKAMGMNTPNKVQNLTTPQRTAGDNNNQQLCPDGTYPPCKLPGTQKFEHGGAVVISSNVDKDLL